MAVPFAFTVPFRTALVSVTLVATSVVAVGLASPVPLSATTKGFFEPVTLLPMDKLALRTPAAEGENCTRNEVVLPGVSEVAGSEVKLKSAALAPLSVGLIFVSDPLPGFWITKSTESFCPTAVSPNETVEDPFVRFVPPGDCREMSGTPMVKDELSTLDPAEPTAEKTMSFHSRIAKS